MLEKKIKELDGYFDGILRLGNNCTGVKITIPETWKVYGKKSEKYVIQPTKNIDGNPTKVMFVGDGNCEIGDIMDFISEVISNNLENEEKKELFKSKITELTTIFDSNRLAKLYDLTFKFEKAKKVKKEIANENIEQNNENDNAEQ